MVVSTGRDSLPPSGPGSRSRRRWFLSIAALAVLAALIAFHAVLLPFLLAIVLAYVLSPLVAAGERARIAGVQAPRWVVVVVLYAALIGTLVALVSLSVPRLAAELQKLTREAPRVVAMAREEWLPSLDRVLRTATDPYLAPPPGSGDAEPDVVTGTAPAKRPVGAIEVQPRAEGGYSVVLPEGGLRIVPEGDQGFVIESPHARGDGRIDVSAAVTEAIASAMDDSERTTITVLHAIQRFVIALSRGVFTFVLTLMLSAYMLITSDRIFAFIGSLYPPYRRPELDDLIARIDRGLAGVVRGQLMICAVNGVLSGIGFYLLDLKYWTFLTLIATVGSIVPIFGSIASTIPAVIVALPDGLHVALLTVAWIVGVHQIEANLLNPKIMGDAARVHPVLVVFALLAGEHAAGIWGALLAVPVLSISQTLFLYLRERFLGVPRSASSIPPPPPESATRDAPGAAAQDAPGELARTGVPR